MAKPFSSPAGLAMVLAASVIGLASPEPGLAWGASGHRIIGRLAIEGLPPDLPAFMRTKDAVNAVGELAREPDRWKHAGLSHDSDRDPAHFLDLDDAGRVGGGPRLVALPSTREGFETSLRRVGTSQWRTGYLPYSIVDAEEQLAKDFAYWRVETAAARTVTRTDHRAWLQADASLRESLILRDVGVLAHYVGDGSQPLHVTVHFNGWGLWPNPGGFTQEKIHARFEGAFVHDFVDAAAVKAILSPYRNCGCSTLRRAEAYLSATSAEVAPLYRLEKAGGLADGDARGRTFVAERLAAGVDELRDDIIDAWRDSLSGTVGYPQLEVRDVLSGRVDPFDALFGTD